VGDLDRFFAINFPKQKVLGEPIFRRRSSVRGEKRPPNNFPDVANARSNGSAATR
jgi:hypothetical protein